MMIKKLISGLAVICILCVTGTALAAGPEGEPETSQETDYTLEISVEDITAVMEQLGEYETELDMLAQLVYAEARGVGSEAEQAAVIWCVLNRYDAGYWGDSIPGIIRSHSQFAYSSRIPVKDNFRDLAQDVLIRWLFEKRGITNVGRVLPNDYYYFAGRSGHNWFRKGYRSNEYWDWSLPDPYEAAAVAADSAA